MRFLLAIATMLVPIAACVGSTDLCGNLANAPQCDSTTGSKCQDALSTAKAAEPTCAALIDSLAQCIASLSLKCTGSDSISANGTGDIGGGQNFTSIGPYDVVVNDAKCDIERRGLEACRTCPDAVGATQPHVLGIGDICSTGACADGLTCQGGICTHSCSQDSDCHARADGCQLQFQYANVCAGGTCTRSCGSDYDCEAWVSTSSTCQNSACTL